MSKLGITILPFAALLTMTQEKIEETMIPIRAKKVKLQAETEMNRIDGEIATLQLEIQKMSTNADINIPAVLTKVDQVAMLQRRRDQYAAYLDALFPEDSGKNNAAGPKAE